MVSQVRDSLSQPSVAGCILALSGTQDSCAAVSQISQEGNVFTLVSRFSGSTVETFFYHRWKKGLEGMAPN